MHAAVHATSDLALYLASLPYLPPHQLEQFRHLITSASMLFQKLIPSSRSQFLEALNQQGHREAVMRRLTAYNPQTQDKSFTAMQEILPNLFIGSYHPASNRAVLRSHGITHVCCCIGVPPPFPGDFVYHVFPAKDVPEEDILRFFRPAVGFIDQALTTPGCRVLVHCGAGISRAATTATAYLMHRLRLPFKEALALVHGARPFVRPNPGFVVQLKHWENVLALEKAPFSASPVVTTAASYRGGSRVRATSLRPFTAQLSVTMPELRPRPVPATVRAQSAAVAARRREVDAATAGSFGRSIGRSPMSVSKLPRS